jgi:hypothetical protein
LTSMTTILRSVPDPSVNLRIAEILSTGGVSTQDRPDDGWAEARTNVV